MNLTFNMPTIDIEFIYQTNENHIIIRNTQNSKIIKIDSSHDALCKFVNNDHLFKLCNLFEEYIDGKHSDMDKILSTLNKVHPLFSISNVYSLFYVSFELNKALSYRLYCDYIDTMGLDNIETIEESDIEKYICEHKYEDKIIKLFKPLNDKLNKLLYVFIFNNHKNFFDSSLVIKKTLNLIKNYDSNSTTYQPFENLQRIKQLVFDAFDIVYNLTDTDSLPYIDEIKENHPGISDKTIRQIYFYSLPNTRYYVQQLDDLKIYNHDFLTSPTENDLAYNSSLIYDVLDGIISKQMQQEIMFSELDISNFESMTPSLLFTNLYQLILLELKEIMASEKLTIKECLYCNNLFISSKSNQLYCDNQTCKKLGPDNTYYRNLVGDKKILYCAKKNVYQHVIRGNFPDCVYTLWLEKAEAIRNRNNCKQTDEFKKLLYDILADEVINFCQKEFEHHHLKYPNLYPQYDEDTFLQLVSMLKNNPSKKIKKFIDGFYQLTNIKISQH